MAAALPLLVLIPFVLLLPASAYIEVTPGHESGIWSMIRNSGRKCWFDAVEVYRQKSHMDHYVFINYNPVPVWNVLVDCSTFHKMLKPRTDPKIIREVGHLYGIRACLLNDGKVLQPLETITVDYDHTLICSGWWDCTWRTIIIGKPTYTPEFDFVMKVDC